MQAWMRTRRIAAIPLICLMAIALSSCAGLWPSRGGRIVPDREATLLFEKKQCTADYQYYYSGAELYPHALIGIRKDVRLEDDTLWKKIAMTPERCKDMVEHMQTRALGLGMFPHGFVIQDEQGRRIGVWYSILTATTPVSMIDDRTAVIHTPPVDTYMRYEREQL